MRTGQKTPRSAEVADELWAVESAIRKLDLRFTDHTPLVGQRFPHWRLHGVRPLAVKPPFLPLGRRPQAGTVNSPG